MKGMIRIEQARFSQASLPMEDTGRLGTNDLGFDDQRLRPILLSNRHVENGARLSLAGDGQHVGIPLAMRLAIELV